MGFTNLTYKVVVIINEIIQKHHLMPYLGKCKFSIKIASVVGIDCFVC